MAEIENQVAESAVTDSTNPAKKPAPAKAAEPKASAEKNAPTGAVKTPAAKKPAAAKATDSAKKVPAEKADKKAADKKDDGPRYRLRKRYAAEIVPALMSEKGYKNINEVPKLEKIILNMRLGDVKDNAKSIQLAQGELEAICGQKSVLTRAKKSVANFKLREDQPVGVKVTLRGERMFEFLDKLVSIALPRVRDFRGLSGKSFDGRGNYAMGVKEQIIFPEISYEQVEKVRGFDICIVTTAKSDDEAKALLVKLGMPFKN